MENRVRYLVEWCKELPKDENGDADMDGAKYARQGVVGFKDALALALAVLPKDCFGSVSIEEQELREDFYEDGTPRRRWCSIRQMRVDDPDWKYSEKDLEGVE